MTARDVEVREMGSRRRSGRDFGLVVGVDHYPRFRSLQGAAADAIAFHAWMCDPGGGGVAPAHARLITSTPEPPTPLQDHVDEQVVELVQAADALGGARRLYVYFSGHGATCLDGAVDDLALLLAKWSPVLARLALSANRYCSALGGLGVFEEVAMFLDCCRGAAVGAVGLPPTFTCRPASAGAPARTFIAYATEAGRAAFEQPREGVWHGAFTRRLLWILKRSPHGIEAAALKDALERELRADAVQRAHVVNGLSAGSTFGRRGAPPILELKPDDAWEGDVELYDGTGQLVARHRPSEGTWTIPLAAGLYKLTHGVGGERAQRLVDHGVNGPTSLDLRPRLRQPIVRVWSAASGDRWIPAIDDMQVYSLPQEEPLYIGSAPECAIRIDGEAERSCDARIRRDGECYVIEDLGGSRGLLFHGRIEYLPGSTLSPGGERIRCKQLRDGDVFRCGALRLLVGHVEDMRGAFGGAVIRSRSLFALIHELDHGLETERRTGTEVSRLSLRCVRGVSVTVYDATGAMRGEGEGGLEILLPHGLYRIEAELLDRVRSRVIELDDDTRFDMESPSISTPATMISDDRNWHRVPASIYSAKSTTAPLGAAPRTSRLMVLLRRSYELRTSPEWPSEPVSILDGNERLLADLSPLTGHVGRDFPDMRGLLAFSCEVEPGAYCLRASRSRRNVALTIPEGYVTRIFVADVGTVCLDDMRVSFVPTTGGLLNYWNYDAVTRAMEGVIAALRSPRRRLPRPTRARLRALIPADLCFGIAAAHLLARAEDREALDEVLDALAPHAEIPDVAILQHAYAPRAPEAALTLTTPPLLRASLQLAMTHPAFDLRDVPADSALSRAASRGYADSIWCTWSHDADDERWIAPTLAELRRSEPDVVALGRRLGIPPRRVQQALDELDAGASDTERD